MNDQRLNDLVRYARLYLFDEGLITQDELNLLIMQPSSSARRLDDYDSMRAEIAALTIQREADAEMMRAEIAALREYVRWRETGGERRMEPLSTEAISAFGRALEEKP